MATVKPELKAILDKYGISASDKSQVWDCHGTLVLYHKAFEIIAAKERISFDAPTVVEGNTKERTVAVVVVGRMGDRSEWSIGEAAPANNKNSYPYAMAEKRGKDRVIAKLVGLSAYVYSEEEADEFKEAKGNGTTQAEAISGKKLTADDWREKARTLLAEAEETRTPDALMKWQMANDQPINEIRQKSKLLADWLMEGCVKHHDKLTGAMA